MALRLCLGTSARFSILRIPHFASRLLQPIPLRIAGSWYSVKAILKSERARAKIETEHIDDNFTVIYKFPYIVQATALCKMKLYQTVITTVTMPVTIAMNSAGLATIGQCQFACGVCFLACLVLYAMSTLFRRLVGILYLNDAKDTLKISHLTFMGQRRNTMVEVLDVVPLADAGASPKNIYYPLKLYSSKTEFYYYILRFGGVVQPDMFSLVFGEEALRRIPQKFSKS